MRITVIAVIILSAAVISLSGRNRSEGSHYCRTAYPVVLVHGLGFRDVSFILKYWGDIPKALRKRGCSVFHGGQKAFGSHRDNALLLKKKVLSIIKETGSSKVNIIAHSKGGIESRYMISRLGMASHVASLTTIATPHRGSSMAGIILKKLPLKESIMKKLVNLHARLLGDKNPDSLKAGAQLTVAYMRGFNRRVPDATGVYYQSYCGTISEGYPNPLWRRMQRLLKKKEGPNDGLVSLQSCRWGRFRGIVRTSRAPEVSHTDIVGMHLYSGVYRFDAPAFYVRLVHELKRHGF